MKINSNFLISILVILGGVGGLLADLPRPLSAALIVAGVIGSLWSHLSTTVEGDKARYMVDIIGRVLAVESTNPFAVALEDSILAGNGLSRELVARALAADRNDATALSYASLDTALHLALKQWTGQPFSARDEAALLNAKLLAERGRAAHPADHRFLDVIGILADVEGDHERARALFRASGNLRSDPHWRLLIATSLAMEGKQVEAMRELEAAREEGASGPTFAFYLGRELCLNGRAAEALECLTLAEGAWPWLPELMFFKADANHLLGRFATAARTKVVLALLLLPHSLRRSGREILHAAVDFALAAVCRVSRALWPLTSRSALLKRVHLAITPPDQPEAELAVVVLERGNAEGGEAMLRTAIRWHPGNAATHSNLGGALAMQGKIEEALAAVDRAIAIAPGEERFQRARRAIATAVERRQATSSAPGPRRGPKRARPKKRNKGR